MINTQTISSILTFVLAMVLHPGIQNRARAEIDSVVEDGRLPELRDRESLPYVNCILKEVMRWRLVLPMSESKRESLHIHRSLIIVFMQVFFTPARKMMCIEDTAFPKGL